jgi:rSAM/selenodomain-associated transferase 1
MPTMIVLAKEPVAGRVKTRLCPPCSPEQAAEFATAALVDTFSATSECRADRLVAVFEGDPAEVVPASYEVIPQRTGTLDTRLADAFDDVFAIGDGADADPTLLIAMDTPQVTADQLDHAFNGLDRHDAVIGMTNDGGFWIIGLNSPNRAVFEGVPMSTEGTGAAQLARLESLGLTVSVLPTLRDLDTAADVQWLAQTFPHLRTSKVWAGFGLFG